MISVWVWANVWCSNCLYTVGDFKARIRIFRWKGTTLGCERFIQLNNVDDYFFCSPFRLFSTETTLSWTAGHSFMFFYSESVFSCFLFSHVAGFTDQQQLLWEPHLAMVIESVHKHKPQGILSQIRARNPIPKHWHITHPAISRTPRAASHLQKFCRTQGLDPFFCSSSFFFFTILQKKTAPKFWGANWGCGRKRQTSILGSGPPWTESWICAWSVSVSCAQKIADFLSAALFLCTGSSYIQESIPSQNSRSSLLAATRAKVFPPKKSSWNFQIPNLWLFLDVVRVAICFPILATCRKGKRTKATPLVWMPCMLTLQTRWMLWDCGQICLKHFLFSAMLVTQKSPKIPNHLKPSNNIWTILNHKRDMAERWCLPQFPSRNMPSGQKRTGTSDPFFSQMQIKESWTQTKSCKLDSKIATYFEHFLLINVRLMEKKILFRKRFWCSLSLFCLCDVRFFFQGQDRGQTAPQQFSEIAGSEFWPPGLFHLFTLLGGELFWSVRNSQLFWSQCPPPGGGGGISLKGAGVRHAVCVSHCSYFAFAWKWQKCF